MTVTPVERRKLVKHGPATLTVSVPADWVRRNALKPGNEVSLQIRNNDVVISTDDPQQDLTFTEVDVRDLSPKMIRPLLSAIHKSGVDEVRLRCSAEQGPWIQDEVNMHLLGYEITDRLDSTMIIRSMTRMLPDELPGLVRRLFLIMKNISEAVADNPENAQEVLALEKTVNRITNYAERILVQNAHRQENVIFTYIIIWLLEKIADEFADLVESGKAAEHGAPETCALCSAFYELYYQYSHGAHLEFLTRLDEAVEEFIERRSPYLPILQLLKQTKGSLIASHLEVRQKRHSTDE